MTAHRSDESRIGLPTQQHGEGGHFAAGSVTGKTGKTPDAPLVEAVKAEGLPAWLTAGQKHAVEAWLSQFQPQINQAASGGDPGQWAGIIHDLDAAIAAAPTTSTERVVHRELPVAGLAPGTTLRAPGYTATSPTALSATSSQITIPAGSRALELPGEVLLPRGTQFKVESTLPTGPVRLTVLGGSTPKSEPRQLSYYRALWMRTTDLHEREEILSAVRRISGEERP